MRREFHVRFSEGPGVQFPRATRLVIGFELEEDARRVMSVLGKRLERFGLKLHPEKTRLFSCARPSNWKRRGKGPTTFDFLGFTAHWRRSPKGF